MNDKVRIKMERLGEERSLYQYTVGVVHFLRVGERQHAFSPVNHPLFVIWLGA
jgi:hypothetical protein